MIPIKCLKGLQACLPCPDTSEGVLSLEAKSAKAEDEGTRKKKKLFISPSLLRKSSEHPIPRPVSHTHKDLDPYS